jgi:hypothetical protein
MLSRSPQSPLLLKSKGKIRNKKRPDEENPHRVKVCESFGESFGLW